MNERPVELQAILSDVRRRWTQRSLLRAWTLGSRGRRDGSARRRRRHLLVARDGFPLHSHGVCHARRLFALGRASAGPSGSPTDAQLARFIEERAGELDDVVVTAVDYAARPDSSPRDARTARRRCRAGAVGARSGSDRVARLDATGLRAGRGGECGVADRRGRLRALVRRATNVAAAYLFPARIAGRGYARVDQGPRRRAHHDSARVVGRDVRPGADADRRPSARNRGTSRWLRRTEPGVSASRSITSPRRSRITSPPPTRGRRTMSVTVVRPPRVERIDVHYEFPRGLGLEPRTDEDSGDIYGPPGTKVRLDDHDRQADHARVSDARRREDDRTEQSASRSSTAG